MGEVDRFHISVVMPVYNARVTLPQAVRTVQRQRGVHLEMLCVDDGSTDGSGEWLEAAAAADARIRVVTRRQEGIVSSLNAGLERAKYPLIARMDADDVAHPDRLRRQAEYMRAHPEVGVVGSLVRSFPVSEVSESFYAYESWSNHLAHPVDIAREIFVESPIVHPSAMYRRDEVMKMGGYQAAVWAEDYGLWLRYHQKGYKLAKVNRVLLGWRMRRNRLSFHDARCSLGAFLRCKAHYLAKDARVTRGPVIIWGAGMTGRRLGKALIREGVQVAAFVDVAPTKIGTRLMGRRIEPTSAVSEMDGFIVVAVGTRGVSGLIRAELRALGRREGPDSLFAA